MLKSLFKGTLSDERKDESKPGKIRRRELDIDQIKTLIEYFPIGKRLRYYPEYKKEIVFDTLLVGYGVNGHFLYSWEAIEFDAHGKLVAFRLDDSGKRLLAGELELFQMLIPDTSHLENTLDYDRRAQLGGRGRQFNRGNMISLISSSGAQGLSVVDTEVDKKSMLRDGPYAHSEMVIVTPELDSLTVSDQRRLARAKILVPVRLSTAERALIGPCTLVDMSESAVRVRVRDGETLPVMQKGQDITLYIDIGEEENTYRIKGSVIRRSSESCVIKLQGCLQENGTFRNFAPLELMEIKARLLNYGK